MKKVVLIIEGIVGLKPIVIEREGIILREGMFVMLMEDELMRMVSGEVWEEKYGWKHPWDIWQLNYLRTVLHIVPFVFKVKYEPTIFLLSDKDFSVVSLELSDTDKGRVEDIMKVVNYNNYKEKCSDIAKNFGDKIANNKHYDDLINLVGYGE